MSRRITRAYRSSTLEIENYWNNEEVTGAMDWPYSAAAAAAPAVERLLQSGAQAVAESTGRLNKGEVLVRVSMPETALQLADLAHLRIKDIRQGILRDCYLLASLGAMTLWQGYIPHLLVKEKSSFQKGFTFRFFPARERLLKSDDVLEASMTAVEVTVMPRLLASKAGNRSIFALFSEKSAWVTLIEKAYAEFCGGYEVLNRSLLGSPAYGLTQLTGLPTKLYSLEKDLASISWKEVQSLLKDSLIVVGTAAPPPCSSFSCSATSSHDIVWGHAYTVIEVRLVRRRGGTASQIVLFNPWNTEDGLHSSRPRQQNRPSQQRHIVSKYEHASFHEGGPGIAVLPWEALINENEFNMLYACCINPKTTPSSSSPCPISHQEAQKDEE